MAELHLGCFHPMNAVQSNRLAVAFARETARSAMRRLCTACVEVLGVTGAGITIMGGDQDGSLARRLDAATT